MRIKAALVIGGLIGYVFGTRAGREQYDKIAAQARRVWDDPRVQDKVGDATERANTFVSDKAPDLQAKFTETVRQAGDQLRDRGNR